MNRPLWSGQAPRLPGTIGRRRLTALAAVAAVIALAVVIVDRGGGSGPPDEGAAALVPADALAFASVSTDPARNANRRLLRALEGFRGFAAVRDRLLARVGAAKGSGVGFASDVRPWLGDEAAVALLNTGGTRAASVLVLRVGDRARAQRFLAHLPVRPLLASYRGVAVADYGPTATAFVAGYLVVGQDAGVRAAIDRTRGASSLAGDPAYRQAVAAAPVGRSVSVYLSAAGLRRLLRPQRGLLRTIGTMLDAPDLAGASLAVSGGPPGLRVWIHRATASPVAAVPLARFVPALAARVPAGAVAYVGLAGLDRLGSALGGARGVLGLLAGRLAVAARGAVGRQLRGDVLPLLRGEVALWLAQAAPAPILTLVAGAPNEERTRTAIAALTAPLLAAFSASTGSGRAAALVQRDAAGVPVSSLQLAPGLEVDSAVFDRRLVVSTALGGVAATRATAASLSANPRFRATLAGRPAAVGTVAYLDVGALLDLADRAALGRDPRYDAARTNLRRVGSVGAWSTSTAQAITTELRIRLVGAR